MSHETTHNEITQLIEDYMSNIFLEELCGNRSIKTIAIPFFEIINLNIFLNQQSGFL